MKTVYKYPILLTDTQELELPENAEILTIQIQNYHLELWALVEPSNVMKTRQIRIAGTGHPFDHADYRYISTAHLDAFVWHFFEIS